MKLECCICAEKLGDGVLQVMSTKCGHLFHKDCISTWLTKSVNGTCPQCRADARNNDLRNIYLSNISNRSSDIFNSSIVSNLRDVQEDLCIMQTNLEREIEQLKADKAKLKERADLLNAQHSGSISKNVDLKTKIEALEIENDTLKQRIDVLTEENIGLVHKNIKLKTEMTEKNDKIAEKNDKIADLKDAKKRLKDKNYELQDDNRHLQVKIRGAVFKVAQITSIDTNNNTPKRSNTQRKTE